MERNDILVIGTISVIGLCALYLLLGSTGLLPDYFYEQCDNISLDTAIDRGCCEDRSAMEPVSWLFGADTCDRYRSNETIGEEK